VDSGNLAVIGIGIWHLASGIWDLAFGILGIGIWDLGFGDLMYAHGHSPRTREENAQGCHHERRA
jgi:hypothetical protein